MRRISLVPAMAALGLVASAVAYPAVGALAQGSALSILDGLTMGAWEVRPRGGGKVIRRICVKTGRELIQLRHRQPGCNRFVVEDGASGVTVQYACAGNGYGRTNIRRETSTLVQIESQGIAGSLPFEITAEARRVGKCS